MLITIAGATGFIGRNLLRKIKGQYNIRGLGRGANRSIEHEWRQVDLFSYQSTKKALVGTDVAIYLVHSMLPSSKLFQGNFRDTDLFLADNFAKACVANGIKQIIYLGGLVPIGESSEHLKSRLEVEEVFKCCGIPTTILRAGMIVGNEGSSFEILRNLVSNLPAMILPKWTSSLTQLVYIDDLLNVINEVIGNPKYYERTLNIVNGEDVTYKDLIKLTARHMGKKCPMIPVPINYLSLSKKWVSLFGQAPIELVSPLIDSLKCNLPRPEVDDDIYDLIKFHTYEDMLKEMDTEKFEKKIHKKRKFEDRKVRSIQRLENPKHLSADEIACEYMRWLPKYLRYILYVKQSKQQVSFMLRGLPWPLLKLLKVDDNTILDRAKFHIIGGILSKTRDTGWLEFRNIAKGRYTIVSINEFYPALPWYIYCYAQAKVHLIVMHAFGKHLFDTTHMAD